MTTKNEALKDVAASARICWTCGGDPNPTNFGGLCDPCDTERKQRLSRSVKILEQYGQTDTQEYRALRHLGY